MSLWVPPSEASRQAEGARAHNARVLSQVELHHELAHWNRELKAIDPYVQIVKAPDGASGMGLKPGYWHVLRTPPVGHPTILAHETPDGGYRDLDSGIFQTLRDGDMWNAERERDRKKYAREAERARERESEREREERIDELTERIKALTPGIMVPRSV